MKNVRIFLSENFPFLFVKFSIYLNRHVFVMVEKPLVISPICDIWTAKIMVLRNGKKYHA